MIYPLDRREPAKHEICAAWLRRLRDIDRLTMSPQVLNESYWVVQRKPQFEPARLIVREYLTSYQRWARAPMDADLLIEAWDIGDRYGARFWDALLLASANAAGCSHFLSEDLNDGQLYGAVQAVNPFRHQPEDVLGPALSR
ncbi:MAG TPA: PIN domain-containing protein [Phenylobacterium sp.]|nr:PIN domain-containing protein [Phenylobacterium sp.]